VAQHGILLCFHGVDGCTPLCNGVVDHRLCVKAQTAQNRKWNAGQKHLICAGRFQIESLAS
jgi:hypothetical protein